MRRVICILVAAILLLSLCGCSSSNLDSSVSFFYCRTPDEYQYFKANGVISSEERDLTGHTSDLHYMISLYLAGPLEESLTSPFPKKTRLLDVRHAGQYIDIELTDLGGSLSDSEFSLAAACLAQTCMNFTGSTSVTLKSGIRNITITSDNIVLHDTISQDSPKGG